jgi:hypothetical protein
MRWKCWRNKTMCLLHILLKKKHKKLKKKRKKKKKKKKEKKRKRKGSLVVKTQVTGTI